MVFYSPSRRHFNPFEVIGRCMRSRTEVTSPIDSLTPISDTVEKVFDLFALAGFSHKKLEV
jgi:hypothetical protein